MFALFLSAMAVKRPVSSGGSASGGDSGEIAQGEAIEYSCSPESVYDSSITSDVRNPINCTVFTVYDDTVGLIDEGSDWCTFSVSSTFLNMNCTSFCQLSGTTCIDSYTSVLPSDCDNTEKRISCDESDMGTPPEAHSCVCWDASGSYVSYWNIEDRDFTPMLIFVIVFPFFFFTISGFMYWKAESLEDQLEAPKDKMSPRGSMTDGKELERIYTREI